MSSSIAKPLEQTLMVATLQELKGLTIVVDAGHGGKDNGASAYGIVEDTLNLEVALELKKIVELAGGQVLMTREGDYDLASNEANNRKKEDLTKRVELIEENDVALFVSVHMNKYGNSQVRGAQVFYRVSDEISKLLADCIQKEFKQLDSSKLIKMGNYFILNESSIPGVLVECGFMSNEEELKLLQQHDYQVKVAHAIYRGIVKFVDEQYSLIH